ncbi:polyketide synthase protein [Rutstroemia sp. NJR-2017a WRK4]|nr:polyketide synthase protein [Rutstroemia sp. NJR-2017a WRK4]
MALVSVLMSPSGINDSREWSPCISEGKWNEVLTENGFSGNDLILRDFENETCHQMSVIVSTAITSTSSEASYAEFDLVLLVGDESDVSSQYSLKTQSGLNSLGMMIDKIVTLQQATKTGHAPGRTIYISLLDLKRPFLRTMSAEDFTSLQSLLNSAKGILWVSGLVSTPECGMIDGLARVIRGESNKLVLVTVSLEADDGMLSQHQIGHLQKIMQRTPWDTLNSDYETAFVESHSTIEVGRIEDDDDLSQKIIDYSLPNKSTVQKWAESLHLEMKVENPGLLDTLYFAATDVNTEPLAADEIEVNVKASGIIFRDVLTALGKLDGGYLGLECAGVITRVGKNSDFHVGQRVCGLASGSFSSHIHMNRHCAMVVPPGMSFTEAASLPVAFYTAYCTLESARIRKGESILIHSAAGATGQAAIQLSRYFGISEIYATVGTEEKKQLLRDHYDIPETHIFSSRDTDFAEHIKRSIKNGVDIVLNSLSGKGLLASWECLTPYGRFLEIGKSDIIANNSLPMQQFLRNVTFSAFDLSTLVTERPERLADATKTLERLWIEKTLRLVTPLHVYPVSQAEDALRFLQSGKSSGKIVLEMLPDSLVKVISNKKPKELFRADRTYVVVGGLGGLGRSIARWMTTRGAKNLLLLSRSGPKVDAAVELIRELEAKGVTVRAPVCDIANPTSIKAVLADYATHLPPIAGCIQAAMVLRDSLFEKMSFTDWNTALAPKVSGSWNLHKLLPSPLDFFIMLSSACGILGQVGQANYAAGNTYQDALARYRVSQSEHGISIDLGAMMLEGYVSENEEVSKRLLESGYFHPLTQDNLFALLEHCCDPSVKLTQTDSQIIFGLARPTAMSTEEILTESRIASPLFRSMHTQDTNSNSSSQFPASSSPEINDFKQNFISAPSIAEAGAIVTTELVKKLSRNLPSMSSGKVDLWQPMMAYGVDSLLSVELRSWFAREFAADVGIFETMNGATFSSIGLTVARNSRWRSVQKEE